jgi:hypothetical protein
MCGHCSESGHGNVPCPSGCGGCHPSADKKCPVFVDEKEIQDLKVKEGLTFSEAWK